MSKSSYIHTLVRGVILSSQHVLLAHCKGAPNTFLPGGHVAVGESLSGALRREVREELGLDLEVREYIGLVEHQWGVGQDSQHEINHVFAAHLPGATPRSQLMSREPHLEVFWIPIENLAAQDLRPPPLINLIHRLAADEASAFFASTLDS